MTINISKITLEKTSDPAKIDLNKSGEIKVTLRWNKTSGGQKKSFWSSLIGGGESEIDLDLGACVETTDGEKFLVDPLQQSFQRGNRGSLSSPPYLIHSGDDRAGGGGEVIRISAASASRVRQIWLYAFIYEGAARWSATDAVVLIEVPGQPPVEIPMGQQSSTHNFCALGHLAFSADSLVVKRLVTFHGSHSECDSTYQWGFRWREGSK